MVEKKWMVVLTALLEAKCQEVLGEWGIEVTREEVVGWLIVDLVTMENAGGQFFISNFAPQSGTKLDLSGFTEEELGNGVPMGELVGIIRSAAQVPVIHRQV